MTPPALPEASINPWAYQALLVAVTPIIDVTGQPSTSSTVLGIGTWEPSTLGAIESLLLDNGIKMQTYLSTLVAAGGRAEANIMRESLGVVAE